ncbi:MAG: Ig-like domain-containing protein [Gemmatimonadales bacterium]
MDDSIEADIRALFPPGPSLQDAAIARVTSARQALAQSNTSLARTHALLLVDLTLTSLKGGLLVGAKSETTRTSASKLINRVYQLVALDPPNVPDAALTDDGAARIVGPEGGTVVTPSGVAGVQIPAGTLPSQVLVTVTRIPAPATAGTGPLPTNLKQYPPYYEFSTSPATVQFGDSVRVGVCQVTDPSNPLYAPEATHDRLRLAHSVGASIEILERVAVDDFLRCTGVTANVEQAGWGQRLSSMLGSALAVVLPAPLYAAHGGLGGKTKSFSPFAAVDPASAPVQTVVVSPSALPLVVGSTGTLTATTKDAAGNMLTGRAVTWSSSNNAIATVNGGLVTAIGIGTATITAGSEGKNGTAAITVSAPPPPPTPQDSPCGTPLKSTSSDTPTTITFDNRSTELISWYWLDFNGAEVFYASVLPGAAAAQPTFATHPWVVKGASGRCFGIYVATAASRIVVIQ